MTLARVTLILGGTSSGKSLYGETLVEGTALKRLYVATGSSGDAEMAARIARHKARRGKNWRCIEEPLELGKTLQLASRADTAILADCLTLWLSNLMAAMRNITAETDELLTILPKLKGPLVLVSNEVGLGIVPENALAREFRDHQGRLNQKIAKAADRVIFMTAGLPMILKPVTSD